MATEKWDVVRCDDGRLMVCTAGDVVCHPDYNHHPYDVWDARNFPKIAAAPVMLEALVAAKAHLEEYVATGYSTCATANVLTDVNKAIALAAQVQS